MKIGTPNIILPACVAKRIILRTSIVPGISLATCSKCCSSLSPASVRQAAQRTFQYTTSSTTANLSKWAYQLHNSESNPNLRATSTRVVHIHSKVTHFGTVGPMCASR